ncbi:MAG: hypothetical protein CM15mV33_390 [uncultured marine virus]|nr:MAG: hypothetical protein CM15mV33_390 [uncultured marine virus]
MWTLERSGCETLFTSFRIGSLPACPSFWQSPLCRRSQRLRIFKVPANVLFCQNPASRPVGSMVVLFPLHFTPLFCGFSIGKSYQGKSQKSSKKQGSGRISPFTLPVTPGKKSGRECPGTEKRPACSNLVESTGNLRLIAKNKAPPCDSGGLCFILFVLLC